MYTKYVYGLGLISQYDTIIRIYHFDYRGSTAAVTTSRAITTDTFTYDTYGKLISRTGTLDIPFTYNGRDGVITDDNGLYYMRARYYSPEIRRFINADIVAGKLSDAITLNRFAYANGNPVSNIDPFGLSAERGIKDIFKDAFTNFCVEIYSAPEEARDYLIEFLTGVSKEAHYSRNDYNIEFPDEIELGGKSIEVVKDEIVQDENSFFYGWNSSVKAQCHQFTSTDGSNVKFVSPDGKYEAIYDANGKLVTAPEDIGTYNYASPINEQFPYMEIFNQTEHGIKDVVPWIFWGNSVDDTTTFSQRLGSLF